MIAAEADIKKLFQQVEQVVSCRRDIPVLTHEAEAGRNQIIAALGELHPGWNLADLERFRATLLQRDRVDRMAEESVALRQAEANCLQYKEREAKLKKDRQELERLKAVPPAPQWER